MLSPFLPSNTSLTRLGVPSNGMRSVRVTTAILFDELDALTHQSDAVGAFGL